MKDEKPFELVHPPLVSGDYVPPPFDADALRRDLQKLRDGSPADSLERRAAAIALEALPVVDWSCGEECSTYSNEMLAEGWYDTANIGRELDGAPYECDCGSGQIRYALTGDRRQLFACYGSDLDPVNYLDPRGEPKARPAA